MTWHSLSSPGFPRIEFPEFTGTMECSDFLRPSRRAWLPSLGDTLRCVCGFAPNGPERATAGLGFVSGPHCRKIMRRETFRFSQVPGESSCAYALLFDPGRTDSTGHTSVSARPPLCPRRRLPRRNSRGSITRPWHSLSTLRGLGRPSAARKTRFPLLATLRGGIGYPQDSNERFPSCFLHLFLPSQAFLAQGHTRFSCGEPCMSRMSFTSVSQSAASSQLITSP